MYLYVQTADASRWRRTEREAAGILATHRLMRDQQKHCGLDASRSERLVAEATQIGIGNANAPMAAYCKAWIPEFPDWIWIVDDAQLATVYVGPRAMFSDVGAPAVSGLRVV
jgi:hypothetical protein